MMLPATCRNFPCFSDGSYPATECSRHSLIVLPFTSTKSIVLPNGHTTAMSPVVMVPTGCYRVHCGSIWSHKSLSNPLIIGRKDATLHVGG